jgi:hypothetical protein
MPLRGAAHGRALRCQDHWWWQWGDCVCLGEGLFGVCGAGHVRGLPGAEWAPALRVSGLKSRCGAFRARHCDAALSMLRTRYVHQIRPRRSGPGGLALAITASPVPTDQTRTANSASRLAEATIGLRTRLASNWSVGLRAALTFHFFRIFL